MTKIELKFQLRLISGKSVLRFTEIQSAGYIYLCVVIQIVFYLNYVTVDEHKFLFPLGRNLLRDNTGFINVSLKLKK